MKKLAILIILLITLPFILCGCINDPSDIEAGDYSGTTDELGFKVGWIVDSLNVVFMTENVSIKILSDQAIEFDISCKFFDGEDNGTMSAVVSNTPSKEVEETFWSDIDNPEGAIITIVLISNDLEIEKNFVYYF